MDEDDWCQISAPNFGKLLLKIAKEEIEIVENSSKDGFLTEKLRNKIDEKTA